MIAARELTKVFRTADVETTALRAVTLEVDAGEFVAVMGPSGCGKSTLLNLLGLLDRPTSGTCRLFGQDVQRLGERERARLRGRNIGFVFQGFNLIDHLSVRENVELPLLYQGIAARSRRRRALELLERFGLGRRASHHPSQLSGGQQQRVAFARAVVARPRLLLADEPTGNLDTTHGERVMRDLEALSREGTAIVMVTHSPEHAARAGRIVRLRDGAVVFHA